MIAFTPAAMDASVASAASTVAYASAIACCNAENALSVLLPCSTASAFTISDVKPVRSTNETFGVALPTTSWNGCRFVMVPRLGMLTV